MTRSAGTPTQRDPRQTVMWRETTVPMAKARYPWVCHLCGQPIPASARHPDPMAFEPDHVLPVATHPWLAHDLSNIRPSHRRCNAARKDRPLTQQLIDELTARFAGFTPPALDWFGDNND